MRFENTHPDELSTDAFSACSQRSTMSRARSVPSQKAEKKPFIGDLDIVEGTQRSWTMPEKQGGMETWHLSG